MIVADDGGAQVSFDAGANWSTYYNQPTSQIYRVTTDNGFPTAYSAHSGIIQPWIKSATYNGSITDQDWSPTAGFESGYVNTRSNQPDICLWRELSRLHLRHDHKTSENRAISVWPDNTLGAGVITAKYRFNGIFPIFFSPHNPKKLYAAGNVLFHRK